jgi:hypothetical protein
MQKKNMKKGPRLRFSDHLKYPLKKIWLKPQGPPWISNYFSASIFLENKIIRIEN